MRGIGEPIWAGRNPDELVECQLHESLINLAFAAADDFRLICPYDTAALARGRDRGGAPQPPRGLADGGGARVGGLLRDRQGRRALLRAAARASARCGGAHRDRAGLRDARRLVRARAEEAGLGERSDDFVLAVNEVLSNSLYHAREDGMLRVWEDPDGLVCEVRDGGHIVQPLIGREEPALGQIGGHGIWLVNLVCDLVQVRSSAGGSTVRMQMQRPS